MTVFHDYFDPSRYLALIKLLGCLPVFKTLTLWLDGSAGGVVRRVETAHVPRVPPTLWLVGSQHAGMYTWTSYTVYLPVAYLHEPSPHSHAVHRNLDLRYDTLLIAYTSLRLIPIQDMQNIRLRDINSNSYEIHKFINSNSYIHIYLESKLT